MEVTTQPSLFAELNAGPRATDQHRPRAQRLPLQRDGKIVVGMTIDNIGPSDGRSAAYVRLNSDGSVDPTFRCDGPEYNYSRRPLFSLADGVLLLKELMMPVHNASNQMAQST
jgi:hypothetical protein